MRIIKRSTPDVARSSTSPSYVPVGPGVYLNERYSSARREGLSVTYDPYVLRRLEENLVSDAEGERVGKLAVFWSTEFPVDIVYPDEII